MRPLVLVLCTLLSLQSLPRAEDKPAGSAEQEKALAKLSNFIGGVWTNNNPKFKIEFRYEWVFKKTAIRGVGFIDKGGPNETVVESTIGWDPTKKAIYYVDFHGSSTLYKGTIKLDGDEMQFDFETAIGRPGKWRSTAKFPEKDIYESTILGEKDGKWSPMVTLTLKRKSLPADENTQKNSFFAKIIGQGPPDR